MLEKLNKYYEDELVQKQVHPVLPLTIWNYTPKVQYGEGNAQYKFWDDVTKQCRGLVTDNEGNVVAYHYESQTRNEDPNIINKSNQDYQKNLFPFVVKHLDKLKNYIIVS